jgi:hypothetical protein
MTRMRRINTDQGNTQFILLFYPWWSVASVSSASHSENSAPNVSDDPRAVRFQRRGDCLNRNLLSRFSTIGGPWTV